MPQLENEHTQATELIQSQSPVAEPTEGVPNVLISSEGKPVTLSES